jgi:hypothetical protein
VQLREQSFKPARLSTGFHPHSHLHSLGREIAIKLFRFLTVLQSPFLELPTVIVMVSITLKIPLRPMSTIAMLWGITLERAREAGKRHWESRKLRLVKG